MLVRKSDEFRDQSLWTEVWGRPGVWRSRFILTLRGNKGYWQEASKTCTVQHEIGRKADLTRIWLGRTLLHGELQSAIISFIKFL